MIENLLKTEFALAYKCNISPIDLHQMDYAEVVSLNQLLQSHLKKLSEVNR